MVKEFKIKEILFLHFVGFWLLFGGPIFSIFCRILAARCGPIFSDGGGHDPLDHPPKSATGLRNDCVSTSYNSPLSISVWQNDTSGDELHSLVYIIKYTLDAISAH